MTTWDIIIVSKQTLLHEVSNLKMLLPSRVLFKFLSVYKVYSHCPVVIRGLQAHMHESLQSPIKNFKIFTSLCTQYTATNMFSKQDITQINLLLYLSCCLYTKLLSNVNLRSSTPVSTSFVDITSLLQQVSPTTFSLANRNINPLLRVFLSFPFFLFLPWPAIFFSQTAVEKINELGVSSLLNFLVYFCLSWVSLNHTLVLAFAAGTQFRVMWKGQQLMLQKFNEK